MSKQQIILLKDMLRGMYSAEQFVVTFSQGDTYATIKDYSSNPRGINVAQGTVVNLINMELEAVGLGTIKWG